MAKDTVFLTEILYTKIIFHHTIAFSTKKVKSVEITLKYLYFDKIYKQYLCLNWSKAPCIFDWILVSDKKIDCCILLYLFINFLQSVLNNSVFALLMKLMQSVSPCCHSHSINMNIQCNTSLRATKLNSAWGQKSNF